MLTSPSKIRRLALDTATTRRPHCKFTRVSKKFLDAVEAEVRKLVEERVMKHPTRGRTLE